MRFRRTRSLRSHCLETSLSAQAPSSFACSWIPSKDADERRPQSFKSAPRQGSRTPHRRRQTLQESHALIPAGCSVGVKRAWRLKSEADVQRVWRQGSTWAHPLIILRARANGLDQSRVAFVVSKKVGKAVARNRAKRLMREATRQKFPHIVPGYDIVLIGRNPIVGASLASVSTALDELIRRARLFR